MTNKFRFFVPLFLVLLVAISSCKKDDDNDKDDPGTPAPTEGKVSITMNHHVGNAQLKMDSTQYINSSGENYDVTELVYFISNITFKKADGTVHKVADSYHFVDASDPQTQKITVDNVPVGDYTELHFIIGVDSVISAIGSSAFTGDLLPQNSPGMYWAWAPGFKFIRFEGNLYSGGTHGFSYHIGGFSDVNNCIQEVNPDLHGDKIEVRGINEPEIHTIVDLAEFFMNPVDLSIATFQTIHSPGTEAVLFSENYKDMITVDHIHN